MAHSNPLESKVIVLGLSQSGKTSIKQVVLKGLLRRQPHLIRPLYELIENCLTWPVATSIFLIFVANEYKNQL